ncbi:hypothetical protein M231_07603 [Tremella mesenterica]|uniref:Uncharacterized protein n=1 Tax=Tremella mesenterica TaxID=5217 RepID=A0A4Q1BDY0_TREME|nr:uncharacterized protein TREMEDRAFT_62211 [Tremella mesenterica DSM 1558]EIW69346.1 hypothetical protein TREMEDRAFT_62211 [Tremella mesenterica DSM 1558]RXK35155.1 hypothetical protein M231_07603 [Tremella mesenterica]
MLSEANPSDEEPLTPLRELSSLPDIRELDPFSDRSTVLRPPVNVDGGGDVSLHRYGTLWRRYVQSMVGHEIPDVTVSWSDKPDTHDIIINFLHPEEEEDYDVDITLHATPTDSMQTQVPQDIKMVTSNLFRYEPNGNAEEDVAARLPNLVSQILSGVDKLLERSGLKRRLGTKGLASYEQTREVLLASALMQLTIEGLPGLKWTSPPGQKQTVQEVGENINTGSSPKRPALELALESILEEGGESRHESDCGLQREDPVGLYVL